MRNEFARIFNVDLAHQVLFVKKGEAEYDLGEDDMGGCQIDVSCKFDEALVSISLKGIPDDSYDSTFDSIDDIGAQKAFKAMADSLVGVLK